MRPQLSKIEIARRQLGTALAMHIAEQDPVSVHVLACGGCEIAEQLAMNAQRTPFRAFVFDSHPEMDERQHKTIRNKFWNVFKHARTVGGQLRDDDALLEHFTMAENDVRLFSGWFDYAQAAGAMPIEAQVFNTWFLALDLAKFADDFDQDFIADLATEFPGLATMPYADQRQQLRDAIGRWKGDRRLADSPLTDCRPLILS